MGYMHIDNLYKNTEILMFNECYALEKIHGTSAHVSWKDKKVNLFPGGEAYERFVTLFHIETLEKLFKEHFDCDVTIFGEAYGGKQQGMSATYGKDLKFVVFDVKVGESWLSVPQAEEVAKTMGLEFVDYALVSTKLEHIDAERDKPSTQAKRNGIKEDKIREGVVLRPPIEVKKNNGQRIIVKHKRDEFRETATKREVDPEKLKILTEAKAIADEWVTPMRLTHVLDKIGNPTEVEETGKVIKAMIGDVMREARGEIKHSKEATKAIGAKTAQLFKKRISKV